MSNLENIPKQVRQALSEELRRISNTEATEELRDISFSIEIPLDDSIKKNQQTGSKVLLKELLTAEQLLAMHAATEYWRAIYVREQKGIVQRGIKGIKDTQKSIYLLDFLECHFLLSFFNAKL